MELFESSKCSVWPYCSSRRMLGGLVDFGSSCSGSSAGRRKFDERSML